MAGPALIDPPRISTTRMIANSSTTDSEMATTDHTLRSVRSPGPGVQPRTPPPEPSCHQPGPRMPQVTHRRSGPPGSRLPPCVPGRTNCAAPYGNSTVRPYGKFREIVAVSTHPVRRNFELLPQARRRNPGGYPEDDPKAPKTGHFTRVARECYAPISHDECGQNNPATAACSKG
jgi:hypothetical protein